LDKPRGGLEFYEQRLPQNWMWMVSCPVKRSCVKDLRTECCAPNGCFLIGRKPVMWTELQAVCF
jgi:hypothetical protein